MDSVLSVTTTPATDLALLTIRELRAVIKVSDGSQDIALKRLGSRVADRITQACNIAADGRIGQGSTLSCVRGELVGCRD